MTSMHTNYNSLQKVGSSFKASCYSIKQEAQMMNPKLYDNSNYAGTLNIIVIFHPNTCAQTVLKNHCSTISH